jgi:Protein of unknown function (DUF5818)
MKAIYAVVIVGVILSFTGIRAETLRSSQANTIRVATANEAADTQNYNGTIMLLNGSLYILRDDQNQTWYHLDDQEMPAKFLGKKVNITGELEVGANMIHVRDIEPVNSNPGN